LEGAAEDLTVQQAKAELKKANNLTVEELANTSSIDANIANLQVRVDNTKNVLKTAQDASTQA
jgi:hypothetical protein